MWPESVYLASDVKWALVSKDVAEQVERGRSIRRVKRRGGVARGAGWWRAGVAPRGRGAATAPRAARGAAATAAGAVNRPARSVLRHPARLSACGMTVAPRACAANTPSSPVKQQAHYLLCELF